MNYTPLPAHLINKEGISSDKQNIGIVTKAMVGVTLMLFVVLGTFTVLLFQAPKGNSRAASLPPTPPFVIPTIFVVPSQSVTPETTPSGRIER